MPCRCAPIKGSNAHRIPRTSRTRIHVPTDEGTWRHHRITRQRRHVCRNQQIHRRPLKCPSRHERSKTIQFNIQGHIQESSIIGSELPTRWDDEQFTSSGDVNMSSITNEMKAEIKKLWNALWSGASPTRCPTSSRSRISSICGVSRSPTKRSESEPSSQIHHTHHSLKATKTADGTTSNTLMERQCSATFETLCFLG